MKKIIEFKKPFVNTEYRFMFKKDYMPKKYNILYGGTGSSKSFSMWSLIIKNCLQYSTFDVLIARKYGTTLKDTVETPILNIMTKYFKNTINKNGLVEGRDYIYNRTHKHIRFATGSIIRMKGYDNPEKLKGIDNVNVLILEEATDFTQENLEDIQDRLRSTPSEKHPWGKELKIFMMFNPIFKTHWIRKYFFEDEIDMSEDVHIDVVKDNLTTMALKTTWRDNKFYNGQYRDKSLRKKMKSVNPRKYGVQSNGNWGVLGELIYENVTVIDVVKDETYYEMVSTGLDFGFSHATASHRVGYKDGNIYIWKELYKSKLTATDIAKQIKKMYIDVGEHVTNQKLKSKDKIVDYLKYKFSKTKAIENIKKKEIELINIENLIKEIQREIGLSYKSVEIFADNARPEAIEDIKRLKISRIKACTKGQDSVLNGIEWLQDRRIYVDKTCVGAINEFESYQWKKDKKTGERLPVPEKINDDAMDDIRYACEKFRKITTPAWINRL